MFFCCCFYSFIGIGFSFFSYLLYCRCRICFFLSNYSGGGGGAGGGGDGGDIGYAAVVVVAAATAGHRPDFFSWS